MNEVRDLMSQRKDAEKQEKRALEDAIEDIDALYTGDPMTTVEHQKLVLKADYKGATPRDVAKALLKYRPENQRPSKGEPWK